MAGQVGIKSQASGFDTLAVVDQFNEVLGSSLSIDEGYLRRAGIRPRHTQRPGKLGARKVSGQLKMELPNVNNATWLFHMFGAVSGSSPTFTFTPGTQVGNGHAATLQTGVTDSSDTVQPFTAWGVKINQWQIDCQVEQYAMLTLDWTARDLALVRTVTDGATNSNTSISSATAAFTAADVGKPISGAGIPAGARIAAVTSSTAATLSVAATATATGVTFTIGVALAAASYASTLDPFTFLEGSVTVAGTPVASARAVTLKCNKGLKTDRFKLGSRYINEQLEVDQWVIDGSITCDFDNLTFIRNAASAAQLALVLTFSNGTDSLTITANIQITGDTPSLTTNGLEEQTVNYIVGHNGTDAQAITAVLVTTDLAAA